MWDNGKFITVIFPTPMHVFSCPGSSIPDLGQWVTGDWVPL